MEYWCLENGPREWLLAAVMTRVKVGEGTSCDVEMTDGPGTELVEGALGHVKY